MERKKPLKSGEDFLRHTDWSVIYGTRKSALTEGQKRTPEYLRRYGFGVSICETDDYIRISYGHK